MKQFIRSRVAIFSSYVEIYISLIILLFIVVASIGLIKDISVSIRHILDYSTQFDYKLFLGDALRLIIGIEFVKMLAKHTPESAIEVLLFAIARKLIVVDNSSNIDIVIGVAAIAILFAIKKFLYTPNLSDPNGFVVDASTPLMEVNKIACTNLPDRYGNSVGEALLNELNKHCKEITEGSYVIIENIKLKIYSMSNGEVERVEVVAGKKKNKFWRNF